MNTNTENIKLLSQWLKQHTGEDNVYKKYVDQKIKSENLRYNISLTIAQIILNLNFPLRTKEAFETIIKEYNQDKGTKLTFEDFENSYWIRVIFDEVQLPSAIRSYLWKIGHDESNGQPVVIPEGKADFIRCLQVYYLRYYEGSNPYISLEKLNEVIREQRVAAISISFFEQREIVVYNLSKEQYQWQGGEYTRHLKNEIVATLWLLVAGEEASNEQFNAFFKAVRHTELWFDNLQHFLSIKTQFKMAELALSLLHNEQDLLQSNDEIYKIWFDAANYTHVNVNEKVPFVKFDYTSTNHFVESISYHKRVINDKLGHLELRQWYVLLLKLIIESDMESQQNGATIRRILKDISRPALVWLLYKEIQQNFKYIIPYLLSDVELIPLAFKLANKIKISSDFQSENLIDNNKLPGILQITRGVWLQMFDITLDATASANTEIEAFGISIAKVLLQAADSIFFNHTYNSQNEKIHLSNRALYDEALQQLTTKRLNDGNIFPRAPINTRLVLKLLPTISTYLIQCAATSSPVYNEFVHLQSGHFDLCIEILRLSNLHISEMEISKTEMDRIEMVRNDLVDSLNRRLLWFYTEEEISIDNPYENEQTRKRVTRGVNDFGFEMIDWGYLFLHLEGRGLLQALQDKLLAHIEFDLNDSIYTEHNRSQFEKIKIYLRSLTLAFIFINEKKSLYEIERLPVRLTLQKLENWIKDLSLKYSVDDLSVGRMDVFSERFVYTENRYYEPLSILLYKSVNHFEEEGQNVFIENLFLGSIDLRKMISAINLLTSKELSAIISNQISNISLDDFIRSISTTTELQSAMIEAVNSTNYWAFAHPLMERIQKHFESAEHFDQQSEQLFFEVNLLIAFKEKDLRKIETIPEPSINSYRVTRDTQFEDRRNYYKALHKIYNERKYQEGISILRALISRNPERFTYQFRLYNAETLLAMEAGAEPVQLAHAQQNWDNYFNKLSEEKRKAASGYMDSLRSISLYHLVATSDAMKFDQVVNQLPALFLYDTELIPTIYNYYVKREMHETAFDYIQRSNEFLIKNAIAIPASISTILENSESTKLLSSYKISFERIRSLSPFNIPRISPETINDKRDLQMFILNEIIHACKIIDEKREALREVTHENRYNDFLQALLKVRFPFWGWSIHDQSRTGTSATGRSAGSADLMIQSGGGKNIALIEALILRDSQYTKDHILKCPLYINSIKSFYMVVYYLGDAATFDQKWNTYKSDILNAGYSISFAIDSIAGFVDLYSKFEDVSNFKIAKTSHGQEYVVYHVMMNMRNLP